MKNEMKKLFTLGLLLISMIGYSAPEVTLVDPAGLPEPYEVAPGTVVTVQWSYFGSAPTVMLTYDQDPGNPLSEWQFSLNPEWTQHSNWTDNGDGTFNITFTVNEEVWIFGAFNTFSGNAYSNVIGIGIASPIVISAEDGFICPTGGDTELISVEGTYDGYQWFLNGDTIADATESTYAAPEAGTYHLVVTDADSTIQSNQVVIETLSLAYTGSLNAEGTELTLTAGAGMDSYQWYKGDTENMTLIVGATNAIYVAPITADSVYYSVEGLSGSCAIMTDARLVVGTMFTPVVITVNADTNEFDNICEGTIITLSIPADTENYQWYKNGNTAWGTTTMTINSVWKAGDYYVVTIPAEWPDVSVQSETVNASYLEIIQPVVSGIVNNSYNCEGDELTAVLVDEGYVYDWYAHEIAGAYGDTDLVVAPNGVYTFTFSDAVYITVVANYGGCEKTNTTNLKNYTSEYMSISIKNYDQQYLCTDSVADIGIGYGDDKWENYQWYQLVDSNWVMLQDDTNYRYGASEPGSYKLSGTSVNCATAVVESNVYIVKHYQDRAMNMYASPNEICIGDTSVITFSAYKWTDIQWLKGDIVMGSSGYEMIYLPIAGDTNKVSVTEFNHYIVKAKHESCPNGLKVTSDPKIITPALNPIIDIGIEQEPEYYRQLLWDTVAFYVFCDNYPLTLSVDSGYDSYQWYELLYSGLDDYELGDPIEGATSNTFSTNALVQWVTVVVESEGCTGMSNPILLSTWVFQDPAVESYNDNQICVDDSALINLAFPGTWVEYYWMHENEFGAWDTVPNSNNDSLWVTEPGQYVIFAFPELCPDFTYTSGVGPTMEMFEAQIFEDVSDEGDEYFYAYPWQGNFEFQWYRNGEPYENLSEIPPVLWKEDLPGGTYSVEITNTQPCVAVSESVVWGLSIGENELNNLTVYPNPTNGSINIAGLNPEVSSTIAIYNSIGMMVISQEVTSEIERMDMVDLPNGLYIIKVQNKDGLVSSYKINKL